MMKLCMLTRFFPYHKEEIKGHGPPHVIYYLSKELSRLGVQVDIVAEKSKNRSAKSMISFDNVAIHYISPPYEFRSVLKRINLYSNSFHILHSHSIHCLSHSLCRLTWKLPLLVQLHHPIPITPRLSRRLNIIFRFADHLILLNTFEALKAHKYYNVPKEKIAIIPNGVNTEYFRPLNEKGKELKECLGLSERKIILFLGLPSPRKGHEYLVTAMDHVIKEVPNAHLLLIGLRPESKRDVRYIRRIVQRSRNLGIKDHLMIITEYIPRHKLPIYYSAADVYVLPSLWEVHNLSMLEALSCGTPVVATRVGSAPDIITNDIGLLVPPKSADELGSAIIKILTSNKAEEMSSNARDLILRKYTWRKVALRLLDVYRKVSIKR